MPVRAKRFGLAVTLVLAACEWGSVPSPRLPQVEQATEAAHGGGERYRTHRACTATAASVDGLVECMRQAGWEFVARGGEYPAAECWQDRDSGNLEHVAPYCFVRTPVHRSGTP
jgi:hypothetical protein